LSRDFIKRRALALKGVADIRLHTGIMAERGFSKKKRNDNSTKHTTREMSTQQSLFVCVRAMWHSSFCPLCDIKKPLFWRKSAYASQSALQPLRT